MGEMPYRVEIKREDHGHWPTDAVEFPDRTAYGACSRNYAAAKVDELR